MRSTRRVHRGLRAECGACACARRRVRVCAARVRGGGADLVAPAAVADGGALEVWEAAVLVHELRERGQVDAEIVMRS